jgi:peroxiredoxin
VAQLRRNLPQFEQAGGRLVLVGMGTPEESMAFARRMEVSCPVISDPDRQLYRSFGLKMASALELLSPSIAVKAISAIAQGHTIGKPIGDIRQLPGGFIIDTGGRIVYSHIAKDPADHPETETILAALDAHSQLKETSRR